MPITKYICIHCGKEIKNINKCVYVCDVLNEETGDIAKMYLHKKCIKPFSKQVVEETLAESKGDEIDEIH